MDLDMDTAIKGGCRGIMKRAFANRRFVNVAATVFVLSLLTLHGCSMQKPGASGMENVRNEAGPGVPAKGQEQEYTSRRAPLKVNYLTPLCDIKNPEIFVYKEKRRLYIVQGDVLVRDYPVGLGVNPKGDKERKGDGRTPEGDFVVAGKNPSSQFDKTLELSYPGGRRVERGYPSDPNGLMHLRDSLLSVDKRVIPSQNTNPSDEICIHGGGAVADWTEGCIALFNSDMNELFTISDVGTPVTVLP